MYEFWLKNADIAISQTVVTIRTDAILTRDIRRHRCCEFNFPFLIPVAAFSVHVMIAECQRKINEKKMRDEAPAVSWFTAWHDLTCWVLKIFEAFYILHAMYRCVTYGWRCHSIGTWQRVRDAALAGVFIRSRIQGERLRFFLLLLIRFLVRSRFQSRKLLNTRGSSPHHTALHYFNIKIKVFRVCIIVLVNAICFDLQII